MKRAYLTPNCKIYYLEPYVLQRVSDRNGIGLGGFEHGTGGTPSKDGDNTEPA